MVTPQANNFEQSQQRVLDPESHHEHQPQPVAYGGRAEGVHQGPEATDENDWWGDQVTETGHSNAGVAKKEECDESRCHFHAWS